jgi:phage gp36-like protein
MAPEALAHTYTDRAAVERLLSAAGVRRRLDDGGDGQADAAESAALDDAIADATETVNYYLFSKYLPARLAASPWVWRRATVLAAYALAQRRGNPAPEPLAERAERAVEELEALADGPRVLPGVPLRMTLAPTWSNVRVDPTRNWRVIRVERGRSSPSRLPQTPDWGEAFSAET